MGECVCVCVCMCVHVCTCMCVHVCVYENDIFYIFVCIYLCVYGCVCIGVSRKEKWNREEEKRKVTPMLLL